MAFPQLIFSFSFITILMGTITSLLIYSIKSHKPPSKDEKSILRQQLPPGPKPWPIIGCLLAKYRNEPAFRWIHNLMKQMNTEIACIRLGNVHVIPVTCPKISCEILKAQDANFATRPISMSTRFTSKGYLTTILAPFGDQWKKMRTVLVTEMLSAAKQRRFYGARVEEANHLVRYVYNQCNEGGLVDVRVAAQHYCGNVTRKMMFNKRFFGKGKKNGGPGFEEEEHIDAIFRVLHYLYAFCLSDYLPCLVGFDLDGHEKIIKEANGIIGKYHDPIIEDRVQQWKDGTKKEEEDFLDVLITLKDDNGNPLLSTDEIKAQITEIMLATVDNPSNAVERATAEMINQPKILEKAVEDLDRVVGKERLVQESDLSQLSYITACAREAFRLHPAVPFTVPHVSMTDTTVANYFIPKGSHVLLSRVGLGRNSKIWDEPHKFKPERHIKNDGSQVKLVEPYLNFISFSTGRRGCPGVTMGTSMTLMLFARLLHGFTWNVPPNQTSIDLKESESSLTLAKPLVALVKPRLPAYVYDQIMHDQ
ncbi:hypothetical protein JCGZ_17305 [Jatropha curcas]|uniref:Cytochrome P450 n=1 Tax=Jatropha curcas TaxID=180498 RepID=A0A067LER3_JATCU|nr:hypothetical protein JCGZ_17305 [Jatropha curcas]